MVDAALAGTSAAGQALPEPRDLPLHYEAPLDWDAMLAFYRVRAVLSIEAVDASEYARNIGFGDRPALIRVRNDRARQTLVVTIRGGDHQTDGEIKRRLRRAFDLDVDADAIAAHLSRDPFLAPLVKLRPSIRVPSHWDPFETAMRAVLGQQVTLSAAAKLNARLVDRAGRVWAGTKDAPLNKLYPDAADVCAAGLADMGMPEARVRALRAVAEAHIANPNLFLPSTTVDETIERLLAIPGIGPWSAQYIALRACGEHDAFPAGDAGLLRVVARELGRRLSADELTARAERWRPWRAYAAHHLWSIDQGAFRRPRCGIFRATDQR